MSWALWLSVLIVGCVAQDFVQFSSERGFYDAPFALTLSFPPNGAARIVYTTDFNYPTASYGTTYSSEIQITTTTTVIAIAIDPAGVSTLAVAHTFIFVNDVINKPVMTSNIVNSPIYGPRLRESLLDIPTVVLAVQPGQPVTGETAVQSEEIPMSFEWIPTDGKPTSHMNGGVKQYGAGSLGFRKRGMRLYFRSEYGVSNWEYPLFEGQPYASGILPSDKADQVHLRSGSHDSLLYYCLGTPHASYIRNVWMDDTQLELRSLAPHGRFSHVYINGVYWGLYHVRERNNAGFFDQYFGGGRENFEVINGGVIKDGTGAMWSSLQSAMPYDDLRQSLDFTNMIDFFLINFHAGDKYDWPSFKNWGAGGPQYKTLFFENGTVSQRNGYKFFSTDLDFTMGPDINSNVIGAGPATWSVVWNQNILEFRTQVKDRIYKLYFNDGALTPAKGWQRVVKWKTIIEKALVAESARWGYYSPSCGYYPGGQWTVDEVWAATLNYLETVWFPQRTAVVLNQLKSNNYYPAFDPPSFNQEGGIVANGFTLTMTNSAGGTVYYTLDAIDPRQPGDVANPNAIVTSDSVINVVITQTTTVKARVLVGGVWSAVHEATFLVDDGCFACGKLAITEIMYNHPAGDQREFLELLNTANTAVSLNGAYWEGTIQAYHSGLDIIQPGQYFLLAKDPETIFKTHSFWPNQIYMGELKNGGGFPLILRDAFGRVILNVSYDDKFPWPDLADGLGYSLVNKNPNANLSPHDSSGWRASSNKGGSPKEADPAPSNVPIIHINELNNNPIVGDDWVELFNPTAFDVDVSGWGLTDEKDNADKFLIPAGTIIPAYSYHIVEGATLSFSFSADGEDVFIYQLINGSFAGEFDGFTVGATEKGFTNARYVLSTGEEIMAPMLATKSERNGYPVVGPLVITCVGYAPEQFIQIKNILLTDYFTTAVPLRINGSVSFEIPALRIPSFGSVYITQATNLTEFSLKLGLKSKDVAVGSFVGDIVNGLSDLRIEKRANGLGVPWVVKEAIDYRNYFAAKPLALIVDGEYTVLQRINETAFGSDPANWVKTTRYNCLTQNCTLLEDEGDFIRSSSASDSTNPTIPPITTTTAGSPASTTTGVIDLSDSSSASLATSALAIFLLVLMYI